MPNPACPFLIYILDVVWVKFDGRFDKEFSGSSA